MTTATLTAYECDHDLLPAVCARCGAPAAARVPRLVPVPPRGRTLAWTFPLFLALYLALPPLIVFHQRWLRPGWVRVPMCPAHRGDWAWRERVRTRYFWPVACVASLAVEVGCLTGLVLHPLLFAHAAGGVLVAAFGIDWRTVGRGEILVVRVRRDRVRVAGVHPAFVTALVEDRARDRVDNPDRRTLRGDARDDFDDEPG